MICSVISSPKGGGAEFLVRELNERYRRAGIEAHAIYFSGNQDELLGDESIIGVSPRNPINIIKIRRHLKFLLQNSATKLVVHAHLTWPFFYVAVASVGLGNLKLIYTEHNTTNRRRRIPLWRYFERLVYQRYSKVICISPGVYESLASWVGRRLKKRLVIIPNGSRIYSMADRPTLVGRKPRLVSIGSLTPKKNFATALCAVSKIKAEIDSYIIIGEGPERSKLENLIREFGLSDVVTLVGWSDSIETHLHAADIQVIPSLWEGFGLVAVEGMSTGLLVVASNVDGLREVLGEDNPSATFVANVQDAQAWAEGLIRAMSKLNSDISGDLALESRKRAEKFTLDTMALRYIDECLGI